MISVTGTMTWRDSLAAYLLLIRPRRSYAIVGVLLLFIAMVLQMFEWTRYIQTGAGRPYVLISILLFLALNLGVYLPWHHYRAFRRSKLLGLPIEYRIDESGIQIHTQFGNSTIPWQVITSIKQNGSMYLLSDSVTLHLPVMKRFIESESAAQNLRILLRENGLSA